MEYLDVVNENGEPTGETVERYAAHDLGKPHRTSHVWVFRKYEGKLQVLLQRRALDKDAFPGCYDISSAGHIPAGEGFRKSAVRELKEELDVTAKEDDLICCMDRHIDIETEFWGKPFKDHQFSRVFILFIDPDTPISFPDREVDSILWMDADEALKAVMEDTIEHCIFPDEIANAVALAKEKAL